jgi:type IV fimbrial biogenesis protein FimT
MRTVASPGFTLIELMVALAVAALAVTVGIPSFREFTGGSALTLRANEFLGDLILARNEAVKRNSRVTVCKRASPGANPPACTTAGGWERGWVVFVDADNSGGIDPSETVLRLAEAFRDGFTLRGNGNVKNRVKFQGNGYAAGSNGQLVFCDGRIKVFDKDKAKARVLIISNTGRLRTVRGNDSDVSLTSCFPS